MDINPKGAFKKLADKGAKLAEDLGNAAKDTADKGAKLAADVSDAAKEATDKATDRAKALANDVANRARNANEQAQQKLADTRREIDLRRYNPVFPETLVDPEFAMPRMIVIADEDERKSIEVCKGSVGWIAKAGGLQVLYLYDTAVSECHFIFHPYPVLDSIYYEDSHEPSKYVNLSSFFSTMQQEQMAELQSIAASLGAKHCSLTSYEMKKEVSIKTGSMGAKAGRIGSKEVKSKSPRSGDAKGAGANVALDANVEVRKENLAESKVEFDVKFEGSNEPVEPRLKWYANDRVILDLIRSRIEGINPMKEYNLNLEYKTSESMPIKAAAKVDAALKQLGATMNFKFVSEVMDESRRKLSLHIEF